MHCLSPACPEPFYFESYAFYILISKSSLKSHLWNAFLSSPVPSDGLSSLALFCYLHPIFHCEFIFLCAQPVPLPRPKPLRVWSCLLLPIYFENYTELGKRGIFYPLVHSPGLRWNLGTQSSSLTQEAGAWVLPPLPATSQGAPIHKKLELELELRLVLWFHRQSRCLWHIHPIWTLVCVSVTLHPVQLPAKQLGLPHPSGRSGGSSRFPASTWPNPDHCSHVGS